MTELSKEEQFKAAVGQIRELMVPKVTRFTADPGARELIVGKLHEALVVSFQLALTELWEAEKNAPAT